MRDAFWLQGMQVGLKGAYDCIKAFSETDFTEDLQEDRRADADHPRRRRPDRADRRLGRRSPSKLVKDATLKVYPGAPHGLVRRPTRTSSTPTCSPSSGRSQSHVDRSSLAAACHRPGRPIQSLIKDVQLTVIEGGPHAIPWTHADQVNTALLEFLRS